MKYIDLFSGIGGFHLAMENNFEMVMACEKNEKARQTYKENFRKYDLENETIFPKRCNSFK